MPVSRSQLLILFSDVDAADDNTLAAEHKALWCSGCRESSYTSPLMSGLGEAYEFFFQALQVTGHSIIQRKLRTRLALSTLTSHMLAERNHHQRRGRRAEQPSIRCCGQIFSSMEVISGCLDWSSGYCGECLHPLRTWQTC